MLQFTALTNLHSLINIEKFIFRVFVQFVVCTNELFGIMVNLLMCCFYICMCVFIYIYIYLYIYVYVH